MGYRTNNLHLFEIDSISDWKEMFFEVDSDWELPEYERARLIPLEGFDSLEDMIEKYLGHEDREYGIKCIMTILKDGHGSFSSDFKWDYKEQDGTYFISISYLT